MDRTPKNIRVLSSAARDFYAYWHAFVGYFSFVVEITLGQFEWPMRRV